MKYIRLTNACQSYAVVNELDSVHLNWNIALNLAPYKYASLLRLQIGPIISRDQDRLVPVYTNLISRTLLNPLREIALIHIPRKSYFIEFQYVKGQLLDILGQKPIKNNHQ